MPTLLSNSYIVALLVFASGALQTLTLAPFNLWWLGPFCVALLLWSTNALNPKGAKRYFVYGWLYGFGLFSAGVSWVYVSINTYGNASPPLAGILTLVFVASLAFFQVFQFWLYYIVRTSKTGLNALVFLVVWVLSDAFRTDFLTGFPWLFLGYGHIDTPLAGWAPILGVYGLSAIIVATGIALSMLLTAPGKKTGPAVAVACLLIIWVAGAPLRSVNWTTETSAPQTVALLQTNIPQELKWKTSQRRKTLKLLDEMTRREWDADIIVWPETAVPMLLDQAKPLLRRIGEEAEKRDTNIITGIPYREKDEVTGETRVHNSIFSFGMGEGINHKQKLVPFGEYVPLQQYLRGLIEFFDLPMSDFRRGPSKQELLRSHAFEVAPFICYEVVYPDFVAERSEQADYLLTVSNDAWFGTSIGPLQHLEMAQMRALENGRYMIRATNNGVSAIIDEKGQIQARTKQFVETTLRSEIKIFSGQTPYSVAKSTPLFLVCTAFLFFFVLVRRKWESDP